MRVGVRGGARGSQEGPNPHTATRALLFGCMPEAWFVKDCAKVTSRLARYLYRTLMLTVAAAVATGARRERRIAAAGAGQRCGKGLAYMAAKPCLAAWFQADGQ